MFPRIANPRRILIGTLLGLAAAAFLASCDLGDEVVTPPPQPVVAQVVITSHADTVLATVASLVQFTAEARDAGGALISGAAIVWSSSEVNVAPVDGTGRAMALTVGFTSIRARSGAIQSAPVVLQVVMQAPSFATDIQPILHPTCSATNCHGGSFPQEGLNLRPPGAYDQLVNRPSSQLPSLLRVEPGDPDNSYFYRKLLPCNPPNCGGARMPRDLPPLSPAQLDLIRNWITTGAQP